jgi:hypothetical protein
VGTLAEQEPDGAAPGFQIARPSGYSDSFAETKAREENVEYGKTEDYKRPSLNSTDSTRTEFSLETAVEAVEITAGLNFGEQQLMMFYGCKTPPNKV